MRALLFALLLAGPAMAAPGDAGLSAYVQGRLAFADQRLDVAAKHFETALRSDPQDPDLTRRAFELALAGGDARLAYRMAASLDASGKGTALSALTNAVAALNRRDWARFAAATAKFEDGGSIAIIKPILEAWGLLGAGRPEAALARLEVPTERGIARSYMEENRAHMLAAAGRWDEAAEAFGAIVATEGANVPRLRVAAAACLVKVGRRDAAITMLGGGPRDDAQLAAARAKLLAGRDIGDRESGGLLLRPADGVANLFLRVSADLSRERANPVSLYFARLGSFAAPDFPEALLMVADQLARQGQGEQALVALRGVGGERFVRPVAGRTSAILADAKRMDAARDVLAGLTQRADVVPEDWMRLADLERRAGNYRAAAAAVSKAIALLPTPARPEDAFFFFLRGSALEQAGDWAAAEPDLRKAVELSPDNATLLNYLGYSLLDRGLKMAEAATLIERALKAEPDNGAIIDSAGWLAYRQGRYDEAVSLLQKAVAAEPADPTIADHLGDALWMAGRRIEARFAWAQAASLEPSATLAPKLAKKLDYGLEVAARLASR
ncbi:tetratricopeptide repeat protein [Sandaracinobacteroides saxicola]|uniref:Tetratricopeptide repeat protein n=1 Tax=Sandaracinobacteroides saxicola TaxID=2759707 RepID=A0A7G5IIC5_9SPHN|nr:tetratricopeptide repeat protein [Sandaracinobacteroides saxicola]QMW23117.1 tetratricopeptide repeat protein [Sandaracinobacteroides saxicola]